MLDLPLLYHAHHASHSEDLPFWLSLASRQGDPILELGCGSGRVWAALVQTGHRVYGLDLDPGMLDFLRQDSNSRLPLVFQADMAAFRLSIHFPLIILPCNTLSTLTPAKRTATYQCVRQHLQPGGLFVASLPNPAALAALPRRGAAEVEEVFPHPRDGEPVQVSSEWQRSRLTITFFWHYDHLLPDGRVERTTLQAQHDLASVESYREALESSGLKIKATLGDYNGSPYHPDSPYIIILAGLNDHPVDWQIRSSTSENFESSEKIN